MKSKCFMYRFFFDCENRNLTFTRISSQPENTAQKQKYLTDQQTGKISADPGSRNEQKYANDPYAKT